MRSELSALIVSLAEIIAKLKFMQRELQRLEKQKRADRYPQRYPGRGCLASSLTYMAFLSLRH